MIVGTGFLIGVAIGVVAGIIAAILIYAIFTKAFDAKMIVGTVGPIAAVLVAQEWFREMIRGRSTDEIVLGAVSAFLVVILYPVVILMVRFGRDVGRAAPQVRRSRGSQREFKRR